MLTSHPQSLTTSPASPRQPPRYICIYVSIYLYLRRLRCNRNERNEPKRALCQSEQQILFFGHFAIRSTSRRPELKRRLLAATRPAPRSVGIVLRSSWSSWSRIRSLTVGPGATAFVFGGGGVAPIVHQSDNKSQKRCRWEPKSIREVYPKYIKKMKEVAVNQKEPVRHRLLPKIPKLIIIMTKNKHFDPASASAFESASARVRLANCECGLQIRVCDLRKILDMKSLDKNVFTSISALRFGS